MEYVENPRDVLKKLMEQHRLNSSSLGRAIKVNRSRVHRIMQGKQGISTDTALRLGKYFGNGCAFWQNLQIAYEIELITPKVLKEIDAIQPYEPK